MILASLGTLPASVEDTDDTFWQNFRDDARNLTSALPEFAKFVSAEARDESLMPGARPSNVRARGWPHARHRSGSSRRIAARPRQTQV
jgi:hypothetical protein